MVFLCVKAKGGKAPGAFLKYALGAREMEETGLEFEKDIEGAVKVG